MTPLFEAASDLQNFFQKQQWRFCVIGGIALLRWGEPRFTRDVDVTLFSGFGREEEFVEEILAGGYTGRIADAAAFARRNRVLLALSPNGVPIDIALGGLPFEDEMVERSSVFTFAPDSSLRTCSAEDLVVLKLFAFRAKDIQDAETVAVRQKGMLDWEYVARQLHPLAELKEQPEILNEMGRLRRENA